MRALRSKFNKEEWTIIIDGRTLEFWIDELGVHYREPYSAIHHKDGFLSYQDVVAKAEQQLRLI
jgi:hypothetical protein